MIISHTLKLIFIKTKKTGGTSFEIALSKYCGKDCIITPIAQEDEKVREALGFCTPRNYTEQLRQRPLGNGGSSSGLNRSITGDFRNHIDARSIFDQVGEKVFSEYTKVTIHRDPIDFLVSMYFWVHKDVPENKRVPFRKWVVSNKCRALRNYEIAPVSGLLSCDNVIRYESLQEDIAAMSFLPNDFASVFSGLSAKAGVRSPDSRNAEAFFDRHGLSEYVDDIRAMVSRHVGGSDLVRTGGSMSSAYRLIGRFLGR